VPGPNFNDFAGVDVRLREQVRAQVLADYGEHTMLPGNKMPRPRRLPTGSLAMDYVTGGGVPFQHITRMWGYWSSGKTTSLLKMFAAAQQFGKLRSAQLLALSEMSKLAGELKQAKVFADQAKREKEYGALSCMYVCPEAPDARHAEALGLNLKDLELVPRTEIEVIADIVQNALQAYHVVGIDSTTATISVDELGHKDGVFQEHPMKRAKAWGIALDWFRARMTPENALILTAHAREKRTGTKSFSAQSAEHPPGGFALNHEPGLILHFMKGGGLKRKANGGLEEIDQDAARGSATASAFGKFQAAGGVLVVKCEKNKVGVAGRSVLLHHDKRTGDYDSLHEYEKFASYYRVLEKNNSWWTLPDGSKTQQIRATLEQDASVRSKVEAIVLRCAEDAAWESELLAGRGQTTQLVEVAS
jgi:RecA/RadA recombinase